MYTIEYKDPISGEWLETDRPDNLNGAINTFRSHMLGMHGNLEWRITAKAVNPQSVAV